MQQEWILKCTVKKQRQVVCKCRKGHDTTGVSLHIQFRTQDNISGWTSHTWFREPGKAIW